MDYEQLMACLGKKTLKVKQAERRKQEDELQQREKRNMRCASLDAAAASN